MPTRVGTLLHLSLSVYARADGSLFWMDDGLRVDLHGAMLWHTLSNVKMRGPHRVSSSTPKKAVAKKTTPQKTVAKKPPKCSSRK